MSSVDIRSYEVRTAAREFRHDRHRGIDISALHLTGANLDRRPGEIATLKRWLAGVSADSSHFRPT